MKQRICTALSLTGAALLALTQQAYAFDDKAFCAEMQETAKTHNEKQGAWIDTRTKSNEMTVTCDQKRIVSKQNVNAGKNDLKDFANQNLQTQWNGNFCKDEHFREAINNGWTMIMNINFADGGTLDLTANCDEVKDVQ